MAKPRRIGRFLGIVAMCLFGVLWMRLAFVAAGLNPRLPTVGAILVSAAIVQVANWRRLSGGLPAANGPINRPLLWTAIGGELVLLAAAVGLLQHWRRPDLGAPVVAVVVGLHFFPLARAVHSRLYWVTGAAFCALGAAGLALSGATQALVVGVGCAGALWITSALMALARSPKLKAEAGAEQPSAAGGV